MTRTFERPLMILGGVAAMVFSIACVNVAGLVLARGEFVTQRSCTHPGPPRRREEQRASGLAKVVKSNLGKPGSSSGAGAAGEAASRLLPWRLSLAFHASYV